MPLRLRAIIRVTMRQLCFQLWIFRRERRLHFVVSAKRAPCTQRLKPLKSLVSFGRRSADVCANTVKKELIRYYSNPISQKWRWRKSNGTNYPLGWKTRSEEHTS